MEQVLISRDDLLEFMGEENYFKFLNELKRKIKKTANNGDCGAYNDEPIWIIAEWSKNKGEK